MEQVRDLDSGMDGLAEAAPPVKRHRKKRHAHAHHGGAWKVAYADFITTMMALFLLLWLVSTQDSARKTQLSIYFRQPGMFDSTQGKILVPGYGSGARKFQVAVLELAGSGGGAGQDLHQKTDLEHVARSLRSQLIWAASDIDMPASVRILTVADSIQIQLMDSDSGSLFREGSDVLTPKTQRMVEQVSEHVRGMSNYHINLEGHLDSHVASSYKDNRDLSADRAQRVMQLMVTHGVPPDRFREVVGYGDSRLLDPVNPLSLTNRRVVITLKHRIDGQDVALRDSDPGVLPHGALLQGALPRVSTSQRLEARGGSSLDTVGHPEPGGSGEHGGTASEHAVAGLIVPGASSLTFAAPGEPATHGGPSVAHDEAAAHGGAHEAAGEPHPSDGK